MGIGRQLTKCMWAMSSLIRIAIYKIKYGTLVSIYPIQHFQHGSTLFVEDRGKIKIDSLCHIKSGSELNAYSGGLLKIGEHVCINRGVYIAARKYLSIGARTEIGPNVVIVDHDHDFKVTGGIQSGVYKELEVIIGKNVWIGANTVILKGCHIGDNCVISAGSIVTGTIPDNTIYIQKRVTELREIRKDYNE